MKYYFTGDLCQMSAQARLLRNYGYDVIMLDVHPTLKTEEEYIKAISLIFTMKCDGWWHYEDTLIENGFCTPYEYWESLGSTREVRLYHFAKREDIWNGDVLLNGAVAKDEDVLVHKGDVVNIKGKESIIE